MCIRDSLIFDRTFAITGVLRSLTVAVAFIGMLAALMALGLERAREIGVLRTLGLTPRQVWVLITAQTGLMGLLAGVLAVPGGLVLAWVLVFVVNRRSFGWTMPLELSPLILLQGVALSVLAAVLAGLYPAWKMATALPAGAVRDEQAATPGSRRRRDRSGACGGGVRGVAARQWRRIAG